MFFSVKTAAPERKIYEIAVENEIVWSRILQRVQLNELDIDEK